MNPIFFSSNNIQNKQSFSSILCKDLFSIMSLIISEVIFLCLFDVIWVGKRKSFTWKIKNSSYGYMWVGCIRNFQWKENNNRTTEESYTTISDFYYLKRPAKNSDLKNANQSTGMWKRNEITYFPKLFKRKKTWISYY